MSGTYNLTAIGDEFKDCGKEAGVFVWRIEKLLPVPWPEKEAFRLFRGRPRKRGDNDQEAR